MLELLTANVRKKNKANAAVILLVISTVFAVFLGINIFVGPKSPMKGYNWLFIIGMVVFFIVWLIIHMRMKNTMTLSMDDNSDFCLSLPLKDGTEIVINKIGAIEPFFGRVRIGNNPKIKEIYLRIFDDSGNNKLTLYTSLGAIHEAPDEFFELDERELMNYPKGDNVYGCSKVQEIYYTIKDGKFVTVKQPTGLQ